MFFFYKIKNFIINLRIDNIFYRFNDFYIKMVIKNSSFLDKFYKRNFFFWLESGYIDFLQKKYIDNILTKYIIFTSFLFTENYFYNKFFKVYITFFIRRIKRFLYLEVDSLSELFSYIFFFICIILEILLVFGFFS